MNGHRLLNKEKMGIKKSLNSILARRDEVIFAYLYGSFLSASWFRDVDIAVFIDEKRADKKEALEYEISLALELEERIHLPVDAKLLNHAPLSFKYEVTKGEAIFSRDEEARFSFVEDAWHRYLDYAPVEREFIKESL